MNQFVHKLFFTNNFMHIAHTPNANWDVMCFVLGPKSHQFRANPIANCYEK